jgi:hypothetical protein
MEIMNVSDQIIQVLDDICRRFGIVIDWTNENIIPYVTMLCTKLVTYEIWTSVAWLVISVVATIVMIAIIKKNRESLKENISDEVFGSLILIGLLMLFGACAAGIISQTMQIIKCITFPELFVFEYIKNMMSSGS